MKLKLYRSTTSKRARIFIQDATSTTGAGLTGLVYNSAGLVWYYLREGDNAPIQVTLSSATLGAYTSGGFKEVSSTLFPGVYEIGIPDAALSAGASVQMMLFGATNMVPKPIEIELDAVNYQSATAFVTGVNSLAPPANWNTDVVQTGDAYARLGAPSGASISADIQTRSTYAGGAVASVTGNVGGNVTGSVGSVAGNVTGNVAGTVASVVGNVGGNLVGNVNGNVVGSVASVTAGVTLADGAITAAKIATDAITAAKIAADAITEIQAGLSTFNAASNTVTLADGSLTAAKIASDAITAAKVAADAVAELQSGLSTLDATAVQTAATAALDAYDPPTRTEATTDKNAIIAALPAAPDNDSISDIATTATKLENMIEADGPDYRYTTNALEQGASGAGGYTQDDRDAATEERLIINEIATDTADIAIIKARVLGMGGASITIQSPLLDAETIQLVRGTDYIAPFTQIGTWKVRGKDAFENHISDFNLIIDADEPIIVPIVAQWVEITATKKELQFYASGLTADNTSSLSEKSNYPFRLVVDLDNDTVTEIGSGVVEMVAGGE